MKKRYAIYGAVEYYANFSGVKCHFRNGAVNATAMMPAVFTTSSDKEIKAVENSEMFKRGRIKIDKVFDDAPEIVSVPDEDQSAEVFAEVTSVSAARTVLLEKGIEMQRLQTKASILEAAKEVGVKFPNWK